MPKFAVVTGATNGLGLATARGLVARGFHVAFLGRSPQRLAAAVEGLGANASSFTADLSELAQVRRVAAEIGAALPVIDVLINNAGVINTKRRLTPDGFEETFAVNHLAHFLLTGLLLPNLLAAERPQVMNVSSDAHRPFKLKLDDLMSEKRFISFAVYGRSKLANLHFTYELARRANGSRLRSNALHPGAVASGFSQNNGGLGKVAMQLLKPFFLTPEKAAETPIWMATDPALDGVSGKYFAKKAEITSNAGSHDAAVSQALWRESERLTGFTWPAIE